MESDTTNLSEPDRLDDGDAGAETGSGPAPEFVSDAVPLYYQLATVLRELIASGRYGTGDRLPSEAELAERYGVSRVTVRQTLQNLADEGLIERRPGVGTFVTGERPFTGTLELDRSIGDLISMGMATSIRLLELREIEAGPEEVRRLRIPEGSRLTRCERVRYYDDEPYCHIVNRMPVEIGSRIGRENWERGSVLRYLEEELGIRLGDARQNLRATLADATLARHLGIEIATPVLQVDYLIRSEDGEPVEWARLRYRSDVYSFSLHLTRDGEEAGDGDRWALRGHELEG